LEGGLLILNEDFVPATVDEAIKTLVESLNETDKEYIRNHDSSEVHFGFGMNMRNNWSMWEKDTPLSLDFQKRFKLFGHGDDLSGLIIQGVWSTVQGENVEEILNETAERFRQHWITFGLDPETGKEVSEPPKSMTYTVKPPRKRKNK
jgi:hypothetical protein